MSLKPKTKVKDFICKFELSACCIRKLEEKSDQPLDKVQAAGSSELKESEELILGWEDCYSEGLIGYGGFAKVLLVKKRRTNKFYAIKSIITKSHKSASDRVKTELEVFRLTKDCPFIIQLISFFQDDYEACFVLDYYKNGTLLELVKKKKCLTEPEVIFYSAEVSEGMYFLHSHGIIHRDLKIDNVMLDNTGHVKLIDFSCSFIGSHEKNLSKMKCGTKKNFPPEIILNSGHDSSADLWAFGLLIYRLLTGLDAFEDVLFLSFLNSTKANIYETVLKKKYESSALSSPGFHDTHSSEASKIWNNFMQQNTKWLYNVILYEEPFYPRFISAEATSICKALLMKTKENRLGVGLNGQKNLQAHPFFRKVSWSKIGAKEETPPYFSNPSN